ncbi:hypothetical protein H4W32_002739 [Actinophytocola algeriensis]|uniref:Uncharacterized protein n=1 Tax=Actinophytocola algeriensis TaxID=1768010 RepID=A0A7W7Q8A9_9PSEU|nr:hypothetical protein [Actinophytocola algeriensis]MBB4908915.1 hypothetical protein [Actinophytocola algeriensis]MBE1474697.1 hypothetical protein [Actinophytocola algeriensis]
MAVAIAGGDAHLGAGMIAVHSPQQAWVANLLIAATVLHARTALGGPGLRPPDRTRRQPSCGSRPCRDRPTRAVAPLRTFRRRDGSEHHPHYDYLVDLYQHAANEISRRHEPVVAHHVQAVTWLIRQLL